MTIDIDVPDQIGDETAASIVDFLYALGDAVGARYDGQIRRHYQCGASTRRPSTTASS